MISALATSMPTAPRPSGFPAAAPPAGKAKNSDHPDETATGGCRIPRAARPHLDMCHVPRRGVLPGRRTVRPCLAGGSPVNICVDCGRVILGEAVTVAPGDSMSGARPDLRAHPPRSPECRPSGPVAGGVPPRARRVEGRRRGAAGQPGRRWPCLDSRKCLKAATGGGSAWPSSQTCADLPGRPRGRDCQLDDAGAGGPPQAPRHQTPQSPPPPRPRKRPGREARLGTQVVGDPPQTVK